MLAARRTAHVLALGLLASVGCATTRLPAAAQTSLRAAFEGRLWELRQSCYVGDLYEDNRKYLLSPQPFEHVHHIVDLDGRPIRAGDAIGRVPAGTAVVVRRVEFPTAAALGTRMLTTPRYNTWVYVEPRDPALRQRFARRPWVLLLPRDLDTPAQVQAALQAQLAPLGSMRAWLDARRPTVQVAIQHKEIISGMQTDELVAAMGEPLAWISDRIAQNPARVAWYGDKEAWVVDEHVVRVKVARAIQAPAAP